MSQSEHRPWPRPQRPWVLAMVWHDLLFAHWPIDPAELRPLIPPALELQTFEGQAWLGVVPFRMSGVRPRYFPRIAPISDFAELNVRTYVTASGKPGVWFFSLDAANALAVELARSLFHLPYQNAEMRCQATGEGIDYQSWRTQRGAAPAHFQASYRPVAAAQPAAAGSLEHWLAERYCLYAANRRGRVWRGEIDHRPWPLQPAEADIRSNSMASAAGIRLPDTPPLLHFVQRLEVVAWALERVASG